VFFENSKYQLSKGRFTLRTMKLDHGRWTLSMVRVHGLTSMVRLHKKLVLRVLGPSLGVNRMWTKKSDHAPKIEGAHFFNTCPKRAILKKIRVWPFSCLLLGFNCLHFFLNVSKMWLANLLTTIFTKNERFNLCTFNVIYMWHVPCVVTTLNRILSFWLNLMLLPPYLAQH
jgi:hypothetical protein